MIALKKLIAFLLAVCLFPISSLALVGSLEAEEARMYNEFLALCERNRIIINNGSDDFTEKTLDGGKTLCSTPINGVEVNINYSGNAILSYQLTFTPGTYAMNNIGTIMPCFIEALPFGYDKLDAISVIDYLIDVQEDVSGVKGLKLGTLEKDGYSFSLATLPGISAILTIVTPENADNGSGSKDNNIVSAKLREITIGKFAFSLPSTWLDGNDNTDTAQMFFGETVGYLYGGYVYSKWSPDEVDTSLTSEEQGKYLNDFFGGYLKNSDGIPSNTASTIIRLNGFYALRGNCHTLFGENSYPVKLLVILADGGVFSIIYADSKASEAERDIFFTQIIDSLKVL